MKIETIQKYETVLPSELIEIWKNSKEETLLNGYFRLINPDEYQNLLRETYFRGNISIPVLVSAFGDIITVEEGSYIGLVKYKNGSFAIITKNFKRFMQNIEDEYFIDKYFHISQYELAVKELGELDMDECYAYVPLLGLGGTESINNLSKVKTKEHIELISQMVGKIGM